MGARTYQFEVICGCKTVSAWSRVRKVAEKLVLSSANAFRKCMRLNVKSGLGDHHSQYHAVMSQQTANGGVDGRRQHQEESENTMIMRRSIGRLTPD